MSSIDPETQSQQVIFETTQAALEASHPELFDLPPDWLPQTKPKTQEALDALTYDVAKAELDNVPYLKVPHRIIPEGESTTTYINGDEGFQIPTARIIAADGFDFDVHPTWAGRRGGGERAGGVLSLDKIIDYARRGKYEHNPRTLEGKIEADVVYAPDGQIFYRLIGGNHRGSAAKLRGDETLTVRQITLRDKDKTTISETEYESIRGKADKLRALEPNSAEVEKTKTHEVQWKTVGEAVEKLGFSPDIRDRAKYVAGIRAEDIVANIAILHSVLAPETDQSPTDFTMSVSSPDGSDKTPLLDPDKRFNLFDAAAGAVQKLGVQMKPGEEQLFLNRASSVLAMAIVLAHPFEDGNGRTARSLAQLVRAGYNPAIGVDGDLQLVGTNRTEEGFRINSYLPKDESFKGEPLRLLEEVAALDIPLNQNEKYADKAADLFASPYGD